MEILPDGGVNEYFVVVVGLEVVVEVFFVVKVLAVVVIFVTDWVVFAWFMLFSVCGGVDVREGEVSLIVTCWGFVA
jgi:hypothetical protein